MLHCYNGEVFLWRLIINRCHFPYPSNYFLSYMFWRYDFNFATHRQDMLNKIVGGHEYALLYALRVQL